MRCPSLKDLPPPPSNKAGWPWVEASPPLPEKMPDGAAWPKISIVTPSYNQGDFIEETIRSVLLQGYPNIEYIIIDGGSTDRSAEIIKKYARWLTYWVSEKDRGQAHAINKGFEKATGEIIAWLNSDDIYFENLFEQVATRYAQSTKNRFWLVAGVEYLDQESGSAVVDFQTPWYSIMDWVNGGAQIHQQGAFWSGQIQPQAGPLIENLHYGFDKEFFARLVSLGYQYECPKDLVAGRYRQHDECKWKRDNAHFKYDWLKVSLMYLPRDARNYADIKKKINREMAFWRIRFSQTPGKNARARVNDLIAAVIHYPSVIFQKDFLGSLRRIFVSFRGQ